MIFDRIKETAKHSLTFGLGSVLNKAIGFCLIPIYTRVLSPSDYGTLALLIVTISLITAVFNLGLSTAMFRSYFDYSDEKNRKDVVSTTFVLILISSILMLLVGMALSEHLSHIVFDTYQYQKYFVLSFINGSITLLNIIPFSLFRIRKQSLKFTILSLFTFVLQTTLIIIFVVLLKKGIWGILLGTFIASILSLSLMYMLIFPQLSFTISLVEVKKLLRFGVPWMPSTLSILTLMSADKIILKYFVSVSETGIYNLGAQFGTIIMLVLVEPFTLIWHTMIFSTMKSADAKLFYGRILTYFLYVGLFVVLGIVLLSKELIFLMAEKSYWRAYSIVPFITVGFLFCGISRVVETGILLKRRSEYGTLVFVGGAVLNIILNVMTVPKYGMLGAAYSFMISFMVICLFKYIIASKLYYVEYEWLRLGKLVLAAGMLFIISNVVIMENNFSSICFKISLIIMFPFILFILSFYSKTEIAKMKSIATRYSNVFH